MAEDETTTPHTASGSLVAIAEFLKECRAKDEKYCVHVANRTNKFDREWKTLFNTTQYLINHIVVLTEWLVYQQAEIKGVAAPTPDEIFPDPKARGGRRAYRSRMIMGALASATCLN